mgnify:CR=1 FL=1
MTFSSVDTAQANNAAAAAQAARTLLSVFLPIV